MLDGIPVSIKSNIAVEEFDLTANSNILQNNNNHNNTPGYDSRLVQKLKEAGAIIIGQTNMDEFGMGSLGTNSNSKRRRDPSHSESGSESDSDSMAMTTTVNPLPALNYTPLGEYIDRICKEQIPSINIETSSQILSPGGSSSGSAASVSMGSSIISVGTDTGGSIRLPAAWCGVVGLKPTYGAISRDGVVSYASSLDTIGVIGPSAACVSYALDVMKNEKMNDSDNESENWQDDVRDSTACFLDPVSGWIDDLQMDVSDGGNAIATGATILETYAEIHKHSLKGLKVGIPAAFSVHECSDDVQQAWQSSIEKLEDLGATVVTISDSEGISSEAVKMSLPAYYVLSSAEASSNLSRYDGLRYGLSNESNTVAEGMKTNPREGQFASTRSAGFGSEVQRRILAGTAVLSSDRFHTHYEGAANVRATITKQLNAAFGIGIDIDTGDGRQASASAEEKIVDLMLIPTAITSPPSVSPNASPPDSTEAFKNDIMTVPISLAGLPSISVPVYNHNATPTSNSTDKSETAYKHPVVGMQIFGPRLSERKILLTAHMLLEGITDCS